jgi:hypothetical protein
MKGRLPHDAVREIRNWWAAYELVLKPRDICRRHRISRSTIYDIVRRRAYKDVR